MTLIRLLLILLDLHLIQHGLVQADAEGFHRRLINKVIAVVLIDDLQGRGFRLPEQDITALYSRHLADRGIVDRTGRKSARLEHFLVADKDGELVGVGEFEDRFHVFENESVGRQEQGADAFFFDLIERSLELLSLGDGRPLGRHAELLRLILGEDRLGHRVFIGRAVHRGDFFRLGQQGLDQADLLKGGRVAGNAGDVTAGLLVGVDQSLLLGLRDAGKDDRDLVCQRRRYLRGIRTDGTEQIAFFIDQALDSYGV